MSTEYYDRIFKAQVDEHSRFPCGEEGCIRCGMQASTSDGRAQAIVAQRAFGTHRAEMLTLHRVLSKLMNLCDCISMKSMVFHIYSRWCENVLDAPHIYMACIPWKALVLPTWNIAIPEDCDKDEFIFVPNGTKVYFDEGDSEDEGGDYSRVFCGYYLRNRITGAVSVPESTIDTFYGSWEVESGSTPFGEITYTDKEAREAGHLVSKNIMCVVRYIFSPEFVETVPYYLWMQMACVILHTTLRPKPQVDWAFGGALAGGLHMRVVPLRYSGSFPLSLTSSIGWWLDCTDEDPFPPYGNCEGEQKIKKGTVISRGVLEENSDFYYDELERPFESKVPLPYQKWNLGDFSSNPFEFYTPVDVQHSLAKQHASVRMRWLDM